MNLKEALDALLSGREIPPDARELLAGFDPELLKEELSNLKSQLEEQENAKLSAEELLKKQLSAALSEKEALQQKHDLLARATSIRRLAEQSGCVDPDYLDFLAGRQNVDLDDSQAVEQFLSQMLNSRPYCFKSALHPGSGSGTRSEEPFHAAPVSGNDRISRILHRLDSAPVTR